MPRKGHNPEQILKSFGKLKSLPPAFSVASALGRSTGTRISCSSALISQVPEAFTQSTSPSLMDVFPPDPCTSVRSTPSRRLSAWRSSRSEGGAGECSDINLQFHQWLYDVLTGYPGRFNSQARVRVDFIPGRSSQQANHRVFMVHDCCRKL